MDDLDAALDDARRALYRLAPDEFLPARDSRIDAADDDELVRALKALRKPTLAAWIVNAHAVAEPELVGQLHALHHRLLEAHQGGDVATLRELTRERRETVARVSRDATAACGRTVSQTVADDVLATFDAAVADPEVATRLGALQRGERWSGFGVSTAVPELSLVPVGRPDEVPAAAAEHPVAPADDRLTEARQEFEQAENELATAEGAEQDLAHRIRRLTTRLTTLQHDLDQARREQTAARAATAEARKVRRSARSALDRAERRSSR